MRTRGLQGGGAPEVGAPGEGPQDRESCGNFAFGVWDVNKRGKYLTRRHSQRCLLRVLRLCVCVWRLPQHTHTLRYPLALANFSPARSLRLRCRLFVAAVELKALACYTL